MYDQSNFILNAPSLKIWGITFPFGTHTDHYYRMTLNRTKFYKTELCLLCGSIGLEQHCMLLGMSFSMFCPDNGIQRQCKSWLRHTTIKTCWIVACMMLGFNDFLPHKYSVHNTVLLKDGQLSTSLKQYYINTFAIQYSSQVTSSAGTRECHNGTPARPQCWDALHKTCE